LAGELTREREFILFLLGLMVWHNPRNSFERNNLDLKIWMTLKFSRIKKNLDPQSPTINLDFLFLSFFFIIIFGFVIAASI